MLPAVEVNKEEDGKNWSNAETLETWNNLAQKYAEKMMDMTMYDESYKRFLEMMLEEIGDRSIRLLDVGSGPGNVSKFFLSSDAADKIHLTGIDSAPNMIEIAKSKFPQADWFVLDCRSLLELRGRVSLFDGVVIGFCVPYLTQLEVSKLLIDCYELLGSHGSIYLSYVPGTSDMSGFKSDNNGRRVYFNYFEEHVIFFALENAGFAVETTLNVDFPRPGGVVEVHSVIIARKQLKP